MADNITDRNGNLLGRLTQQGQATTLTDRSGNYVGRSINGRTYDRSGNLVGSAVLLPTLLNKR